jgi:hypothetical protein
VDSFVFTVLIVAMAAVTMEETDFMAVITWRLAHEISLAAGTYLLVRQHPYRPQIERVLGLEDGAGC